MLPPIANFDWWIVVIIPVVVTLFTTYLQRVLDRIQGNGSRRFNRRSLLARLNMTQRVLERVVQQTFHMHYQQLIWRLIVTGLLAVINMAAARLPGSTSACDANATTTQLITGYFSFAAMLAASVYFGLLISRLNEYYRVANNPVGTVLRLFKQVAASGKDAHDLAHDLEVVTRLALRIQQVRDDRLRVARENWTPEEIQRHSDRFELGKHHITWINS